jgi:hypothetical protein
MGHAYHALACRVIDTSRSDEFASIETIVIDDPRRCTELVVENGAKTRAYVHPARV